MEEESQFKPGVAAIIIIAIGILIFILLFIFTKRQIMRFAQKYPYDGPHATIGMDAPRKLVDEIERRLNLTKTIRHEPTLMCASNDHACEDNKDRYKHIYRMKAVDALKTLEDELVVAFGNHESCRRKPGEDLRTYLLTLRRENQPLRNCDSKLIDEFVECYLSARSDPLPEFGRSEYEHYVHLMETIKSTIIYRPPTSTTTSRKAKSNVTFKSFIDLADRPSGIQSEIRHKVDDSNKDNEASV